MPSYKSEFVGRSDALAEILRAVDSPGGTVGEYAIGTWGIGKTWLGEQAAALLADQRNAIVLALDVIKDRCVPPVVAVAEENASTDVLQANVNAMCKMLVALSDRGPAELDTVPAEISLLEQDLANHLISIKSRIVVDSMRANIRGTSVNAGPGAIVGSNVINASEDPRLRIALRDTRDQVMHLFVRRVNEARKARPIVVLIDSYDALAGHPVGSWLSDLVGQLRATALLLTTDEAGGRAHRIHLRPFTRNEVAEYLRLRLPGATVDETLIDHVFAASKGLPFVAGLAAQALRERHAAGLALTLGDAPLAGVQDLFNAVIEQIKDPLMKQLLRDARLARRIDRGVVQHLLFATDGPQHAEDWRRAGLLLNKLRQYCFVEPIDRSFETFAFHSYLRQTLNLDDPQREGLADFDADAVHRNLCEMWRRRQIAAEERFDESPDDAAPAEQRCSTYGAWYVFEDPAWQIATLEWLYHAGQLKYEADRKLAELGFAALYLRAFWWYGSYAPFAYCDRLLDDWDASHSEDGRRVTHLLRTLSSNYPIGYNNPDKADWNSVRYALETLRAELGIARIAPLLKDAAADSDGEAGQAARQLRRSVRALTSVFLASSCRFTSGRERDAIKHLDDALNWFRASGESTCVVWTQSQKAAVLVQLSEIEQAEAITTEAVSALETEGLTLDHELISNLHGLFAAVATARSDETTAGRHLGLAVLHAYAFLVDPHDPDVYTLAFYEDVRLRAAQQLIVLSTHGCEAARRAIAGFYEMTARIQPAESRAIDSTDAALSALLAGNAEMAADMLTPVTPNPDDASAMAIVRDTVTQLSYSWDIAAEFAVSTSV